MTKMRQSVLKTFEDSPRVRCGVVEAFLGCRPPSKMSRVNSCSLSWFCNNCNDLSVWLFTSSGFAILLLVKSPVAAVVGAGAVFGVSATPKFTFNSRSSCQTAAASLAASYQVFLQLS